MREVIIGVLAGVILAGLMAMIAVDIGKLLASCKYSEASEEPRAPAVLVMEVKNGN